MLSRHLLWSTAAVAALVHSPFAVAQFYDGCSSCGQAAAPAPVMSAAACAPVATCTPVQPVYSTCYQTVPVTTYKRERQTVSVPYYKTAYEDREVTVYEPVSRQRTVEVPTVSYQTVYDNRTVHRDLGRWQTHYQPVSKCAPCQVDPRPGFIGWLNRTGYSFRSAFTPNYRTSRQYVPNVVACNVQVPRQVAVRGTRKVVVNETQMVARKKVERVAVRKLAYRKEEITVSRPVTAYRTVPIGSSLAYGYGNQYAFGYGTYGAPGSSIAFIDDDDDISRTANRPRPDPIGDSEDGLRSADETFRDDADPADNANDGRFQRSSYQREIPPVQDSQLRETPPTYPSDQSTQPDYPAFDTSHRPRRRTPSSQRTQQTRSQAPAARKPIVLAGWKARSSADDTVADSGSLTIPRVAAADRD